MSTTPVQTRAIAARRSGTRLAMSHSQDEPCWLACFFRRKDTLMRSTTSIGNRLETSGLLMAALATTLAAACGETGTGADEFSVRSSAITQITISGRVTKNGTGVAGVPIRLNGTSQATTATNSTGNYSFPGLSTGSYSVQPDKPGCTFSPTVANLNNLTSNRTQNFTATGTLCVTPGPARALVLIDSRLYAQLASNVDLYKAQVEARRRFQIDLRKNQQFDGWTPAAVKSYIASARSANPAIEGVLFIGNIKLPSFYKTRDDIPLTRLYPGYYEDLDGVFTRYYGDGAIDPVCTNETEMRCQVTGGPIAVPSHDFDTTDLGPNPGPELWTSYMPVGVQGTANSYTDFANQLRPYFQKLVRFYNRELVSNGRYYLVSNDKGEQFDELWNAWGKTNIDFYGRPGPNLEVGDACLSGGSNLCYRRWNVESFADSASFEAYYESFPWVSENWQQDSIYINHMNGALYAVAEVNVHSSETFSLISNVQAKALTNAGLIAISDGCGVAGFAQPFAALPTTVDVTAMASDNILVSYLYGASKSVASLGEPAWRGHYGHFPTLYEHLKHTPGSYLGAANKARVARLMAESGSTWELREKRDEMLFGDPFMDLNP
jgi:hypothetical protein